MESLVREMQDPENGVPIRSQKLFLTSIPSAFMGQLFHWPCYSLIACVSRSSSSRPFLMGKITRLPVNEWWLSLSTLFNYLGYDMIEWLMERLNIEDSGEFPLLWKENICQFPISLVHFDMIVLPIDSFLSTFDFVFFLVSFQLSRLFYLSRSLMGSSFSSIWKQNKKIINC